MEPARMISMDDVRRLQREYAARRAAMRADFEALAAGGAFVSPEGQVLTEAKEARDRAQAQAA